MEIMKNSNSDKRVNILSNIEDILKIVKEDSSKSFSYNLDINYNKKVIYCHIEDSLKSNPYTIPRHTSAKLEKKLNSMKFPIHYVLGNNYSTRTYENNTNSTFKGNAIVSILRRNSYVEISCKYYPDFITEDNIKDIKFKLEDIACKAKLFYGEQECKINIIKQPRILK